jgi:phosphopantothenoylcysteine decarboxylase/phosphopantothenate--cysteine ligase
MPNPIKNKKILLCVTGSIACYKAVDLASKMTQAGAQVNVILTKAATAFVSPLTFQSVTGRRAHTDEDLWGREGHILHIGLGHQSDLIVVAPATANTLAKLARGLADNLLTLSALAAACPLIVAPAMDGGMFNHPATQENLELLNRRGVIRVGPEEGHLASGMAGIGRMVEPVELLGQIRFELSRGGTLKERTVIVTAGGTQEPIDPVRVITNRSSGKQGYALAQAALDLGAEVILISAPTHLEPPVGARRIDVQTARDMRNTVLENLPGADVLLMSAAVADFRPVAVEQQKIKKNVGSPQIEFEATADILSLVAKQKSETGYPRVTVGFAAESRDLLANAQVKLLEKKLDLIVANDITARDAGFSADMNRVTIIGANGMVEPLPLISKAKVAQIVLDRVVDLLLGDKIVHICPAQDWQMAMQTGIYRTASLASEGFIHCSRPEQVLGVANTFYCNVPDLVLLWIDPESVEAEIRWENVDGEDFPHIYGPIETNAVIAVSELVPEEDGIYKTLPPIGYSSTNFVNKSAI